MTQSEKQAKANRDNHSNQLNPNNTAYYKSREGNVKKRK